MVGVQSNMPGVLIRRGERHKEQKQSCEDGREIEVVHLQSQPVPRSAKECQEMPTDTRSKKRPGKMVPTGFLREDGPAHTLILDD